MTQPELPPDTNLENHFLLFETYYGALLGWNVLTDLAGDEIDSQLNAASQEWLSTKAGKTFMQKENLQEQDIDYAHVLMNIPADILAKHRIYPGAPLYEIIALDTDGLKAPESG
jgi:hypothetical protein